MSLKAGPIQPVPEETMQVARAAFPKGNLYLTLRDKLGRYFGMRISQIYIPRTVNQRFLLGAWRW